MVWIDRIIVIGLMGWLCWESWHEGYAAAVCSI
jgi:hypothetical protein